MTVVNRQGEQVMEPGNYYEMKFLRGNILSYRPRRKTVCYYDLLARVVFDNDILAKDAPKVITIKEWEFIEYNGLFRSRTYEHFALPYRPSLYDLLNRGYYLIYHNNYSVASGCQVWYCYEGGDGLMRKDSIESKDVCFCVMIMSMYIGYVLTCMGEILLSWTASRTTTWWIQI